MVKSVHSTSTLVPTSNRRPQVLSSPDYLIETRSLQRQPQTLVYTKINPRRRVSAFNENFFMCATLLYTRPTVRSIWAHLESLCITITITVYRSESVLIWLYLFSQGFSTLRTTAVYNSGYYVVWHRNYISMT